MSWVDIKRRYEKGSIVTQSTEDMVARRILRAIGLSEKMLGRHEHDFGIAPEVPDDATLLERAIIAARATYKAFYDLPTIREVKSYKDAEKTLLDLVESNARQNALVYRIKDDTTVRVLIYKGDVNSDTALYAKDIPIPCYITLTKDKSALLVDCDAQDYYNMLVNKKD